MASRCSLKGISAMPINFRIFALIPMGLIVESVAQLDDSILVTWGPDADRRAKLLICLAVEGALLDAYSHQASRPHVGSRNGPPTETDPHDGNIDAHFLGGD